MTTHDFTSPMWTHNASIIHVRDEGRRIRLCIWTQDRVSDGDHVFLKNGDSTTRYRIEGEIDHPLNPGDQYFCWAVFDPRREREEA